MRGGTRVRRSRYSTLQCLRFVALNVNNFAARWETIMNSRADVMTLTETRVNAWEMQWLNKSAAARSWQIK